jgi:peptide-methionine (R)-S-oxide reductase
MTNNDDDYKSRLTPEQYAIARQGGTERAFTGAYWDHHDDGTYRCVCCGGELFDSTTKFESGSGWPSFTTPVDETGVTLIRDTSHGMERVEVRCATCDAHLGHVFPDGPGPDGNRFCINSASLDFAKRADG